MELLTPPAIYSMVNYTMIQVFKLPLAVPLGRQSAQSIARQACAYREMFRTTLRASRRRWAAQLAQSNGSGGNQALRTRALWPL